MKLELCHADTCLPSYWSGHHLATLQVPVWKGMTLGELKEALENELVMMAVGGSDEIARELCDCSEASPIYLAALRAIDELEVKEPSANPNETPLFNDLEEEVEDEEGWDERVYAFFVFRKIEED